MNTQRPDDDPRDAHLLAALRHAPDRDLLPPAQVTAAILGQAQKALRKPARGGLNWRAALERLWQPAPMAAFGTLAMATLIGVMWVGREPPDATPELRPARVAAAPAAPATASASADAVATPPQPALADALRTVAPKAKAAAAAKPDAPAAAKSSVVLPPAAPVTTPEPAAPELRQDAAPERRLAKEAVAETTAQAAAAAPRDAIAKGFTNSVPARARSEATALGAAAAPAPPAPATAALAPARVAEPLAAIDAALAAGARWQASGLAGERPHGNAQRAFWASVRAATQGRWQPAPPTMPPAPWLQLGGGSREAMWWVMDGALHVTLDGRTWRAPVEPSQLREWQEAVARW
jgi:hypothetical protein